MSDEKADKTSPQGMVGKKVKRRHLPASIRYLIIAFWGAIVSLLVFYLLKKMGY